MKWNHRSVERFRFVSSQGGTYGSVVFATIPCVPMVSGQGTGVGSAVLLGGDPSDNRVMDCGLPIGRGSASGFTVWTNAGDVLGYGTPMNRLAIFDLPRG